MKQNHGTMVLVQANRTAADVTGESGHPILLPLGALLAVFVGVEIFSKRRRTAS
jgi:hypothetical protein